MGFNGIQYGLDVSLKCFFLSDFNVGFSMISCAKKCRGFLGFSMVVEIHEGR
jgi:hypothetical protein